MLPGLMGHHTQLAVNHPSWYTGVDYYYNMSGTSQAAAVTTAVVALMLDADPTLSPDDVKCRLLASARPFQTESGDLAYSIFQQGAGVINAFDAVNSSASGCANQGLNIDYDLAGIEHYQGPANQDEDGNYYIIGVDGFAWSGSYIWSGGFAWSGSYIWSGGFAWSGSYIWSGGFAWSDDYAWSDGFAWSGSN